MEIINTSKHIILHLTKREILFGLSNINSVDYPNRNSIASLFLNKHILIFDNQIVINALQTLNITSLNIIFITKNKDIFDNYPKSSTMSHNK